MNYSTGSIISIINSKGTTYTGTVLQIFENLEHFHESLPKAKGFILAIGEVGETYDIIGYDNEVTEVLCETGK